MNPNGQGRRRACSLARIARSPPPRRHAIASPWDSNLRSAAGAVFPPVGATAISRNCVPSMTHLPFSSAIATPGVESSSAASPTRTFDSDPPTRAAVSSRQATSAMLRGVRTPPDTADTRHELARRDSGVPRHPPMSSIERESRRAEKPNRIDAMPPPRLARRRATIEANAMPRRWIAFALRGRHASTTQVDRRPQRR